MLESVLPEMEVILQQQNQSVLDNILPEMAVIKHQPSVHIIDSTYSSDVWYSKHKL
jgi:hypothetical protein